VRAENEDNYVAETLENGLSHLYGQIRRELAYSLDRVTTEEVDAEAQRIIGSFAKGLPDLRALLDRDVEAAFANDPAARSVDEVLLCYSSLLAIIHYRVGHRLHRLGAPLVARIISEIAHAGTGIDIHPGATIGESFFIDHGTGVVIGETAIIGANVRIHQAVTLGGPVGAIEEGRGRPRHPVIEDGVILLPGATLLGRIVIGRDSIIGGNVFVTEDVPPRSRIEPARFVLTPLGRPTVEELARQPEPIGS
jgi:serine O-acetyltransferase